jgi:hypothetical protein
MAADPLVLLVASAFLRFRGEPGLALPALATVATSRLGRGGTFTGSSKRCVEGCGALVAVVAADAATLLGAALRDDPAGMRAFSFSFEIFDAADSLLLGFAADDAMTFLFSLPSFSASLAF